MTERKKPIGDAYDIFVANWHTANHAEKVRMMEENYNTTYEVGKAWASHGKTDPIASTPTYMAGVEIGQPNESPPELREFLSLPSYVDLDFVSFDIETSGFKADWDIVLCGSIKPYGKAPLTFRADAYPNWPDNKGNDEGIVFDLAEELGQHAIVITHYGARFDIKFLRAKLLYYGLPNLPPMFHIDTWKIAKANFAIASRRLEAITGWLELGRKEKPTGTPWYDAVFNNNKDAMEFIVRHNIECVTLLEKSASLGFPYLKSIPRL